MYICERKQPKLNMKYFFFIICLTLIFSCQGDSVSQSEPLPPPPPPVKTVEKPAQVMLYAWVDKLRLRAKPDTKSGVIKELSEGEALVFTGEKTDFSQKVNLRGVMYDEPWMKVITGDDQEGWVYAGGVKLYQQTTDKSRSPYDQCFQLLELGNKKQFDNCVQKVKEAQLKKYSAYVKPDSRGYEIHLLSGEKLTLLDNDPSSLGKNTSLDFRAYYPELGYFVFRMYSDSPDQFLMVNDKDGSRVPLWGFPKPSINHRHFITLSSKEEDRQYNGIQLFSFTSEGIQKQHEHNLLDAKPLIAKWTENEKVELTIMQPSDKSEQMFFELKGAEWVVSK